MMKKAKRPRTDILGAPSAGQPAWFIDGPIPGANGSAASDGDDAPTVAAAASAPVQAATAVLAPPEADAGADDPQKQIDHVSATAINAAMRYPFSCSQSISTTLHVLGYDVISSTMDANAQIITLNKLCQGPDATWEKTTDLSTAWRWANEGVPVIAGQKGPSEGFVTMLLGGPGRRSEILHRDVPLVAGGSIGAASGRAGGVHLGLAFAASDLKLKKVVYFRPQHHMPVASTGVGDGSS